LHRINSLVRRNTHGFTSLKNQGKDE
jgi:hypothetical protein